MKNAKKRVVLTTGESIGTFSMRKPQNSEEFLSQLINENKHLRVINAENQRMLERWHKLADDIREENRYLRNMIPGENERRSRMCLKVK